MMKLQFTTLCCMAALLVSGCAKKPSAAFQEIAAKAEKKDWAGLYDAMSSKSQGQMDMAMAMMVGLGSALAEGDNAKKAKELSALKGRELFARIMQEEAKPGQLPVALGEVVKQQVSGEKATLTVKGKGAKESQVEMVRENGEWKLVMEDMK